MFHWICQVSSKYSLIALSLPGLRKLTFVALSYRFPSSIKRLSQLFSSWRQTKSFNRFAGKQDVLQHVINILKELNETYIGKQTFKQNFEVCLHSHHRRRKGFSSAADKNGALVGTCYCLVLTHLEETNRRF